MNNSEVENKILKAFSNATPDVLSAVLDDCKSKKGKIISMNEIKKTSSLPRILAIAAAFVFLIAGVVGVTLSTAGNKVYTTVSLDVNPGIEIEVNKNEKVLSVTPLNDDARIVVEGLDFKDSSLNVAVNALVGSMLKHGYLNELANSILVSVEGSNSLALRQKLSNEINAILSSAAFNGAVLSQAIDADAELAAMAEEYGITIGKAQLIRSIIKINDTYTVKSLVSLNINELNLLLESGKLNISGIDAVGKPADAAFIGIEEAKRIAAEHAGLDLGNAYSVSCHLDCDDGRMIYEVDILFAVEAGGYAIHEFEIDAELGTVLDYDFETSPSIPDEFVTPAPVEELGITADEAKRIAFNHAGVEENDAYGIKVKFDYENGIPCYEVEFKSAGYEYEYDIDARDGSILSIDKDRDDDYFTATQQPSTPVPTAEPTNAPNPTPKPSQSVYIGNERAKQIALSHAGMSESEITNLKVKFDYDDGIAVYEVEFETLRYEYDYEIDARSGAIIEYDRDTKDDNAGTPPQSDVITHEEAKQVAFKRAGINPSSAYELEIEFDYDDGVAVYDVEFKSAGYEYSVKINAVTGKVIEYECEYDD